MQGEYHVAMGVGRPYAEGPAKPGEAWDSPPRTLSPPEGVWPP